MSKFVQKFSRQIIASFLLFSLILPNVAQAQLLTNDPILTGQVIMEYIGKLLKVVVKNVVVVGAVQVSQKVAKDAAESVATWVWEGAPGKNPLTYMESPGDYIKKQSEAALSDVLDQMSEDVANANLLCVSDPTAALGVLGGIYAALKDKANVKPFGNQPGSSQFSPTPELNLGKCDAGSIALNYQNLTNELSSDELLKRFSNAATGGGSEIDQIVSAQMNALTSIIREQKNAETARLATKSYRDQTSLISGDVIQSSDAVAEDAKTNTAKFQQEQESRQLAGILASGAEAIPSIFATTFANALSKKIIDKLKRGKGTNPANTSVNLSNIFGAGSKNVGNSSAGALYSDTKTAIISEGELDLLSSFAACPDKFNGIDNCVIDEGFASAIRTADAGKALTVREALDQDRLHANFEMVPPAKQALNESRLCAKSAYCFSNLAKLRKARVIPIGWEIAAASADGTGKTTLGAVVAGFNQCTYVCSNDAAKTCKTDSDCGKGNTCTPTRTKETPFCHLIDPNWVLKMPEQICRAKVYGPQLQSELGPDRQEVCSDQASCLAENSSGQCIGAYGYCLREKNTFRFEADECPAQFAGCRTYGNKSFGNISLIDSTIESGSCTDKNTGCMGYFADYLPTGVIDTNSPKVYLNDKAASCNVENIGCTEVQNAVSGKQQFLRLPPAGMGCKGYANDPTACNQYAAACTVDEVGCEVYQPVGSSDPAIPGVITAATKDTSGNVVAWNDECSSECVGYASYYQAATKIEPVPAAATAFIPKSATMCTQDVVGCDAYVNVDTAAKGAGATAYFAQPQKCSDPEADGNNHATYYTWEGSDQAGYQLHQHELVMETASGAPLLDVSEAESAKVLAECTAEKYINRLQANGVPDPSFNSDCRELFDKAGKPFYRLLSKTLLSSPNCVAFRKDVADEANCVASRGKFDKESGSCEYGFLPSGSTQCKVEEVGCRAYAGAAALSPKTVLTDSFASVEGWSGAESSNEGITVGDTVLKFTGAKSEHKISLVQGKTYNVVFWTKGLGSFDVALVNAGGAELKLTSNPIAASAEWRRFEISSAPALWTDEAATISFKKVSGSTIYLENLVVKEQVDVVYAVKNSWKTPLSCDATPDDNIAGAALNCQVYKPKSQANSPQVYLTGFTGLCREKSAGCQKFVSTQNTTQITEKKVSFGSSERVIPADDFVYVIANSKASCPADKKGCSALGLTVNGKTEIVAKINNPEDYENSSCQVKDEWCQTFTMPGGTQRYFKYPDVAKQCEYKEGVEVKGAKYTGWFKKGTTDPCYTGFVSGGNVYGIYKNQDANFGGMAGVCEPEFNACTEYIDHADVSREKPVGQPYYFMNNSRLDTTSCGGKVSLKEGCVLLENTDAVADTTFSTLATYCKSDAANDAQCAGILTKAGVAAADQGKDGVSVAPVVGKKNELYSLCKKAAVSGVLVATDCESQVAKFKSIGVETSGLSCADAAGVKNVQANVDEYKRTCATIPDSNTIVKVRRDRTCAEWLSCQSSISVYDKSSQKFKDVCTALGVCNKLSTDSGAVGQCANWVTPQQMSGPEKIQRALPLTTSRYVSRNVGWYGHEFSGYSLWKKFQPDTVGQFSESVNSPSMKVGVGFVSVNTCTATSVIGSKCQADVFSDAGVKKQITDEFGAVDFNGQCFEQKCWYPIDGFKTETVDYTKSTCRGYPEVDSPFPQSVVENTNLFGVVNKTAQGFKSANICERYVAEKPMRTNENWATFDDYVTSEGRSAPYILTLENGPCECSYKKVTYGQMGDDKYYALKETSAEMAVGKSVFVKELGAAWIKGTVTSFDGGLYKVVSENNQSLTITDPNKIAFIDGDKTKLVAGKNVVALNNDGKWYSAKVDKGGSNIKTTVQYLNSGLTDEDVKALLGIMPSYSSILAQPILDKLDTITKNYPTLLSSIDSIRGHILKVIDAFKKRNAAIEKLKKNLGDSALITDITKNAITGQKLNDAVYNAAKVKYGNGFTAAWESFIEPLVTTIISETKIIDSNLTSASGKIIALGASSKSAGSSVVDTFTGLAVVGHLSNNADAPIGICDGGWFVVGSKKSPNPDAISKTGLSCTRDFDCIDERLLTLKDPKAIAGSVKDEDKESDESGYSYQYSNEDGKCQFKKKETSVYGWEGYCLEKDLSSHINNSTKENPCLTWLPIDVAGSDVYNQYTSAGYSIDPDGSGKYYCAENRGRLNGDKNAENRYSYDIGNFSFLVSGSKEKTFLDSIVDLVSTIDLSIKPGETNNLDGEQAYRGYKTYNVDVVSGKLPELHASEIDFIELEAVKNVFFPDGYTMKIRNDGKATIYQYTPSINAWKSGKDKDAYKTMICPAWTVNNAGLAGFDYLDPDNQYSKTLQQDKIILEPLSYMIRGAGSDYYQYGKNIADYFTCRGSENDDVVYPSTKDADSLPVPMAITGVQRSGVDNTGVTYSVNLKNNKLGQIWFVRIDNQKYRWYSTKHHIEFDRRSFQLGDIIGDNKEVAAPGISPRNCEPSKNTENSDLLKETGNQIGYELRFKFDKDGKFVGIDSASCTQRADATIYAGWKIKVHVRDACMKVAQTVDDKGKNAAFTHRLWTAHPAGFAKAEDVQSGVLAKELTIQSNNNLVGVVPSLNKFGSFAVQLVPNELWYTYAEDIEKTAPGFKTNLIGGTTAKGYSCPAGTNCLLTSTGIGAGKIPAINGKTALEKLFAKVYINYSASLGLNTSPYSLDKTVVDNTANGKDRPPVIFALDQSTCGGVRGGTCTMTKKYGMTVNGVYDDGDTVFGKGSVAATVRFYGYADQNQMPIKRIKVRWDDGSADLKKEGEYRNHKPVCSTQQTPVAVCKSASGNPDYNHVCVTNKDCESLGVGATCLNEKKDLKWAFGSWGGDGNSDEGACEPSYFQFTHAYTFTPNCGDATGNTKAKIATADEITKYKLEGKIGIGERFCVFKPRVQLLDNWNACNGDKIGYAGMGNKDLKCDATGVGFSEVSTPFQGYIIVKE